jgi:hypothetical protein
VGTPIAYSLFIYYLIPMDNLTLESKVTLKEAYLIMFDYLNKHWEQTGKTDDLGGLLGDLSLMGSKEDKQPMDSAIFPQWLKCAKNVLEQEQTKEGYRNADIQFLK